MVTLYVHIKNFLCLFNNLITNELIFVKMFGFEFELFD